MTALTTPPDAPIDDGLRFEMLLAELSGRFVGATRETIDADLIHAQEQIVRAFELDRSTIAQLQDGRWTITHAWALPGFDLIPGFMIKDVPWLVSVIGRGEGLRFTRLDDLPNEAAREKEAFGRFGHRSSAIFPFQVGGRVIGAMAFGTVRQEREWTDVCVNRLRLFVEVIANALGRIHAEEAARKAQYEVERLRDRQQHENLYLQQELKSDRGRSGLVGQSQVFRRVLAQVEQVATTEANVLLVGETGTGKEMLASLIHDLSLRGSRPMVRVSCAAIPETLIESELFGREKGAYTGALSRQIGRFELAHGSTLFLDEVGELPLAMQVKLLRVLETRQFERLGSSRPISVDVRIIAATNRDLETAVREKKFRDDLFYRLNVFPIRTPPLREHLEDLPLLVQSFVREFAVSLGKRIEGVDKDSFAALQSYSWPGNIRELRNVVERAMILATGPRLQISLPQAPLDDPLQADSERGHILSVLEMTQWRIRGKGGAAEILGLKPTTLDYRILKLGLARRPSRTVD